MIIKVCGMCHPDNIQAVAGLGVDMLGFIFAAKSPRNILSADATKNFLADKAKRLSGDNLPKTVAVFVNEAVEKVAGIVKTFGFDYIQLHGNESREYINELRQRLLLLGLHNVKVIKALSVKTKDDVRRWQEYAKTADMLLFDTKGKASGGNGTSFDWNMLTEYNGGLPFLLSGGIGPDDTEKVVSFNHKQCIGIDLNSRFETEPGLKDTDSLRIFIDRIRIIKLKEKRDE